MEKIGIPDTPQNRQVMAQFFEEAFLSQTNVVGYTDKGYAIKESFLTGPNGFARVVTTWNNDQLVTIFVYPGERSHP